MTSRKALIGFVVVAVLGGVLIGLGDAARSARAEAPPAVPLEVPVGRIGDRVVYELHVRLPEPQLGGGWQPQGHMSFAVERTGSSLDASGAARDVVVVRSNRTADGSRVEYVDLASRLSVRAEARSHRAGDPQQLFVGGFGTEAASLPGTVLQGRTFPQGDASASLPYRTPKLMSPQLAGAISASGIRQWQTELDLYVETSVGPEDVSGFHARAWVGTQARLSDAAVIPLHQEVTVPVTPAVTAAPWSVWMARAGSGTLRVEMTQWMARDLPYPLLEERRVYGQSPDGVERLLEEDSGHLVDYRPGTSPIPWQERGGEPAPPTPERTAGGQRFPADGTGSALPYPLSRAVRDVLDDPSLVRFQLWRQGRPEAVLVSARLTEGEHSAPTASTAQWHLFFAVETGEGYEVSAESPAGLPRARTYDRGGATVPPFSPADLPAGPVTLASVERLWSTVRAPAYAGRAPNFVHWGYPIDTTSSLECGAAGGSSGANMTRALARVHVGYGSAGSCLDMQRLNLSALVVDTGTGSLVGVYELRYGSDVDLLEAVGVGSPPRPTPQVAVASVGLAPPAPVTSTVASMSLLALFLVLYFWPTLKFGVTKAWVLWPGYTKLARDQLLDHSVRDTLLQSIRESPGVHVSELHRKMDVGWGTLVYHLAVLERNQLVSSLVDGRHRRFFETGAVDWSRRGQVALLANERTRRLYDAIAGDPDITMSNLAGRLGLTLPVATWHLRRLEEAGLVDRTKRGRAVHYQARAPPPARPGPEVA